MAKIKTIAHIEADVEAACKTHGVRGHLEHSDIENMLSLYSEDEKQARIHGKFQHLIGLRFKQFNRSIHVIRPFTVDLNSFSVYHALDPHPRTEDAGLWLAVDRKGTKFVIDELFIKCQGGVEELALRIKEKNDKYRIEQQIIDPSALIVDQHEPSGKSLAERLNSYNLSYIAASKTREASDRRIEDALVYLKIPGRDEFVKAPELYIFDTCERLIWELEHLRWQEWTGRAQEFHGLKQKAVDKDDHLIEDLGRLLSLEPSYFPPPQVYRTNPLFAGDDTNVRDYSLDPFA
jgi:hypothetical protein